ncbi:hypothetical protein ACFQ15_15020 [Sphingomonas hankookensis]|uniref:hypothetical protein n=1 Tax=Sphingomonas hankookensis TaxID=563996 RepID=UPI001F586212|nr:hypothetical protein [Sphingomonas hankookensis]
MATTWLEAHVPGFAELSKAERRAIADFTMLWTLFESRVLATRGSAQKIMEAVEGWQQTGTLGAASYDRELAYFQDRYVANGEMTCHFDRLKLRANDQPGLVQAVLDGSDASPQGRLMAMLIVALRYRNNLFHGIKWQYKLKEQLDNFSHANAVLMRVLERHAISTASEHASLFHPAAPRDR